MRLRSACRSGANRRQGQLQHLLEQSEREHITIQVIPFATGYPGSGQTILYVRGPVPRSTPSPWTSRTALC